jgi:hypothetical protein
MSPLLLIPLQSADLDRPVLTDTSAWYETHAASKKKSSGGKKASSGKTGGGGKKKNDAYVMAGGGWQVHDTGSTNQSGFLVGGEAGWVYRFSGMQGRTRAAGMGIVQADNASGYDLRAGTFLGPKGKLGGVETGLDVFYSAWAWGNDSLPEAVGVEVPLKLSGTVGNFGVFGGVSGAWTNAGKREADWDLPFHEGEAFAGLSGTFEGFDFTGRYSYRVTGVGAVQTIWVGVQLEGATIWDLLEMGEEDDSGGGKKGDGDDSGGKKTGGGGKKG